eukprot:48534-Ditylum_brightwellii.AAC.1
MLSCKYIWNVHLELNQVYVSRWGQEVRIRRWGLDTAGALAKYINVASSSMVEARGWVQHAMGVSGTFKILCIIFCALVTFAVMGYFGGPNVVIIPFRIIAGFLLFKVAIKDEREDTEERLVLSMK